MQGFSRRLVLGLSAAAVCAAGAAPAFALGDAGTRPVASQSGEEEDKPQIRLSVRGGRGVSAGEEVRYRFSVRNAGPSAVRSVRVTTRLPRSLKHVRGGRRGAARKVVFSLGRIAPGRSRSRLLVARVADDIESTDRIRLRAQVSALSDPIAN